MSIGLRELLNCPQMVFAQFLTVIIEVLQA